MPQADSSLELPSHVEHFQLSLLNIRGKMLQVRVVIDLEKFDAVRVCRHMRRIRYLFRDESNEFLRCEGCGQIMRLPLQPAMSIEGKAY